MKKPALATMIGLAISFTSVAATTIDCNQNFVTGINADIPDSKLSVDYASVIVIRLYRNERLVPAEDWRIASSAGGNANGMFSCGANQVVLVSQYNYPGCFSGISTLGDGYRFAPTGNWLFGTVVPKQKINIIADELPEGEYSISIQHGYTGSQPFPVTVISNKPYTSSTVLNNIIVRYRTGDTARIPKLIFKNTSQDTAQISADSVTGWMSLCTSTNISSCVPSFQSSVSPGESIYVRNTSPTPGTINQTFTVTLQCR